MIDKRIKIPLLRVVEKNDREIAVSLTSFKWISEKHIICVIYNNSKIIWGRIVNVSREKGIAKFLPDSKKEVPRLQVGFEYKYLDSYFGERAEVIFDKSLNWEKKEFRPIDAIEIRKDGKIIRGVWDDNFHSNSQSIKKITKGWDHEHCIILNEKISSSKNEQHVAFKNQYDEWVCESCYNLYVKPVSLGFVLC